MGLPYRSPKPMLRLCQMLEAGGDLSATAPTVPLRETCSTVRCCRSEWSSIGKPMPRYIIDTDDGRTFVPGDPEDHFDCPKKARDTADRVVGAMAEDALPDGDRRVFRAIVRDEAGQVVYEATVMFAGEWKVPLAA